MTYVRHRVNVINNILVAVDRCPQVMNFSAWIAHLPSMYLSALLE